jgi:hypothetical protein
MAAKIESKTIDGIRNAALVFSQQVASPGSSCGLQAGFLNKVTSKLIAKQRHGNHVNPGPSPVLASQDRRQNRDFSTKAVQLPCEPDWPVLGGVTTVFQEGNLDLQFTDDETWESIFASAGFSTQDGVFLA